MPAPKPSSPGGAKPSSPGGAKPSSPGGAKPSSPGGAKPSSPSGAKPSSPGGKQFEKAKLMVHSDPSGQAEDIEFMFNPSELDFTRRVLWHSDVGNRGSTLLPKVNFSGVEPYSFTLQNLLFDTYEKKTSVLKEYINNIKKGATARSSILTRPPVYILTWQDSYFHCVMTSLNYRLTLFLADGTPVKAIVNIALQEVEPEDMSGGKPSPRGKPSPGGKPSPRGKK